MSSRPGNDPMEFLKSLWNGMNIPLPGLMTPTLDGSELDKRIADLKAVAGWLQTNLGMLQMTIQSLELQRATLTAMQAMGSQAATDASATNPFSNPALWPWFQASAKAQATSDQEDGEAPGKAPG